ncbi:YjcQ family protein [Bacillus sp. sid0103]|nr:YjcQ family protein [Bacillus sp. sid0103]
MVWLDNAEVTIKDYKFLEENSSWSKYYKTAQEIRDWVKL